MKIEKAFYVLEIDDKTGAIKSLQNRKGKDFIHYTPDRELFAFTVLDENADFSLIGSNSAQTVDILEKDGTIVLTYKNINGLALNATIRLRLDDKFTYWGMSVQNNTSLHIDKIDFPKVVVPNDLVATGGTGRILSPMMEGVLVDDASLRGKINTDGICTGWGGKYPGAAPVQFSATANTCSPFSLRKM